MNYKSMTRPHMKKPVEVYKRKYTNKYNLNNTPGLHLRPSIYYLWDPETPWLI